MNSWQKYFAPVVVFLLGAVCGGGVVASVMIHRTRAYIENNQAEGPRLARRIIVRELALDPQQRAALDPVFRDIEREMTALRLDTIPRLRRLLLNAETRIRPELRPEQVRKLDRLLAGPRARLQGLAAEKITQPPAPAQIPAAEPEAPKSERDSVNP